MKRSILLKISITLMIAIVFLSCTSSVYAASDKSKKTFRRPLKDWKENNPSVFYSWSNPQYAIMLTDFLNPPPRRTYNGYITEREMPDARAEITVFLTLHDAPIYGLWDKENYGDFVGDPDYSMFEEAKICYYVEMDKFIISEPGADIPNIWDINYPDDWICMFGYGWGSGIFTEYAKGFTPGEQGIFFIYQYAYMTEEGEFIWTYEIIDIYEL